MAKLKEAEEIELKYTKYEIARMLGSRALQIAQGAPFLITLNDEDLKAIKYNPVEIAKKELEAGVLPITVKRPKPRYISDEKIKEGSKEAKEAEKEKKD